MAQHGDKAKYPKLPFVVKGTKNNNFQSTDNCSSSFYQINDGNENAKRQINISLFQQLWKTAAATVLICFLLLLSSFKVQSQTTQLDSIYKKGFQIHPFQKQIGFRSNLDKKYFIDFKGGLSFTALPYFTLELNFLKRFLNKKQTKVYWGAGLSVDEFIFGFQFPMGIEFSPLSNNRQLTFITELAPRLSYSKSYFVNIQFYPHIGVCYYLKTKQKKH